MAPRIESAVSSSVSAAPTSCERTRSTWQHGLGAVWPAARNAPAMRSATTLLPPANSLRLRSEASGKECSATWASSGYFQKKWERHAPALLSRSFCAICRPDQWPQGLESLWPCTPKGSNRRAIPGCRCWQRARAPPPSAVAAWSLYAVAMKIQPTRTTAPQNGRWHRQR